MTTLKLNVLIGTAMYLVAPVVALPAAAQEPPLPEEDIIRMLTAEGPAEWQQGVVRSLGIPPDERSPELLAAMIEALERQVAWQIDRRRGVLITSLAGHGETSASLARSLVATGDTRILPALAWYAYSGGRVTETLADFGHQAVPHLLAVALSPDALGDHARAALHVMAGIVVGNGPGSYEREMAEAAALHLDGPPEGYLSAWSNIESIDAMLEAIALAGALRTPEMLERLQVIANSTPAQITAMTGASYLGDWAGPCARAQLDRTEPPMVLCDPRWWVKPRDGG